MYEKNSCQMPVLRLYKFIQISFCIKTQCRTFYQEIEILLPHLGARSLFNMATLRKLGRYITLNLHQISNSWTQTVVDIRAQNFRHFLKKLKRNFYCQIVFLNLNGYMIGIRRSYWCSHRLLKKLKDYIMSSPAWG